MTIDEATGLPQLPEGEIWVIEEHRILIKSAPNKSSWKVLEGFLMDLYKNRTGYEVKCKEETYTTTATKWFRKVQVEKTRVLGFVREINVQDTLWEEKYGTYTKESHMEYGTTLTTQYYYPEEVLVEADPVTPENVIERCEAIIAARAAKAKRESLYGEYPPKKFDLESIAQEGTNEV